jgi:DNA-binding FrmR family transcriptional regulator
MSAHAATTAKSPPAHAHAHAGDPRTDDILRRLRSVEGHIRGVERMVQDDAYCMDVLNQVLAVQRALKKVSAMVLDRHLHTCATSAIRGEDVKERERVIEEILGLFEATGKL